MAPNEPSHEQDSIPFYPEHVRTEAKVLLGLLAVVVLVGVLGTFFPVGLEEPADPMNTPAHVRAHWYFVFLQQMLKYIPKSIGVVIPVVALVVLTIWPFFDRRPDTLRARHLRITGAVVAMVVIVILTVLGMMS